MDCLCLSGQTLCEYGIGWIRWGGGGECATKLTTLRLTDFILICRYSASVTQLNGERLCGETFCPFLYMVTYGTWSSWRKWSAEASRNVGTGYNFWIQPFCTVFLEQLIVTQMVMKVCSGRTWMVINMFTEALVWKLCWSSSVQSSPNLYIEFFYNVTSFFLFCSC
jgi:hypothetical protein